MRIHSNASTNRRQRQEIASSPLSRRAMASLFKVSVSTVQRWKYRKEPKDRSSRPESVRRSLCEEGQAAALELRRKGLTLDACHEALEKLYGKHSRSALHRLFQANGLSRLSDVQPQEEKAKKRSFKAYEPGFLHIDLTYLPALGGKKRYLYVAIDRATRLVFVQVRDRKTQREAHAFLKDALAFFPFRVHRLLTDNGTEFTNRFWRRRPSGPKNEHPFEKECRERKISHRLTRPNTPKTNGMVERFNRLVKEGAVRTQRFTSHEAMEKATLDWCALYNSNRPHGGIARKTPLQESIRWYQDKTELFQREPTRNDVRAFAT